MGERLFAIARSQFHQRDFAGFLQQVHTAVIGSFPEAGRFFLDTQNSRHYSASPYTAVNVLLLSWEDDDLGVATEVAELDKVLQNVYRYSVESWTIPRQKSHNELGDRLRDFTKKYENEDSLLMVYYGGHGYLNDSRQLLAGLKTWAPRVGEHSFTKCLTDELRQISHSRPFSAANLHHRVLERLKNRSPRFDPQGLSEVDIKGCLRDKERRKCPVHILLNDEPQYRSIVIAPLPDVTVEVVDISDSAYSSDDTGNTLDSLGGLSAFKDQVPGYKHTEALIAIQFESSETWGIEAVLSEIRKMPSVAKAVSLHSVSHSHSSLALLAVPVAVWDLLRDSPGWPFVGVTTSSNLLLGANDTQSNTEPQPESQGTDGSIKAEKWLMAMVQLLLDDRNAAVEPADRNGRTALSWAAEAGHQGVVQLLLSRGANVNSVDDNGLTALYRTAEMGHDAIFQLLLDRGAKLDIKVASRRWGALNQTVLHIAAFEGAERVVQVLLERKVNPNPENSAGWIPLHCAAKRGHTRIVKLLLEHEGDAKRKTPDGTTALIFTAYGGYTKTVRLLLNTGSDVDAVDKSGKTAIHRAAEEGHTEVVRLLLDADSDVNAASSEGKTALYQAVERGHTEVVRLFLDAGFDMNAAPSEGETALNLAVAQDREAVVQLLLEKQDDIEHGVTLDLEKLVWKAVQAHSGRTLQVLLKHGATLKDPDLLIRALKQRDGLGPWLLVTNGADVNAASDGQTPLIIAIENCDEKVVGSSLENGADVKAKDRRGRTPLSVALARDLTNVTGLLQDYGPETNPEDDINKKVAKP